VLRCIYIRNGGETLHSRTSKILHSNSGQHGTQYNVSHLFVFSRRLGFALPLRITSTFACFFTDRRIFSLTKNVFHACLYANCAIIFWLLGFALLRACDGAFFFTVFITFRTLVRACLFACFALIFWLLGFALLRACDGAFFFTVFITFRTLVRACLFACFALIFWLLGFALLRACDGAYFSTVFIFRALTIVNAFINAFRCAYFALIFWLFFSRRLTFFWGALLVRNAFVDTIFFADLVFFLTWCFFRACLDAFFAQFDIVLSLDRKIRH